jgi:hypothetical protein
MLYAFGFLGLFTIGGLTGLFLSALGINVHVTDTYFVVAHFHYIMVGGAVMGYLGGMHFWWPKISGRLYPEGWARLAALIVFIGFNLTFFPQFLLGYMGMPRRYYDYSHMPEFQVLNVLSTAGATVLGVGYLLPMIYFLWSMRYGKPSSDNPWNAAGLEWKTSSRRNLGSLQLRRTGRTLQAGGPRCKITPAPPQPFRQTLTAKPTTRLSCTISPSPNSSATPPAWACGSSSPPKSCSSADCSALIWCTVAGTSEISPPLASRSTCRWAPPILQCSSAAA